MNQDPNLKYIALNNFIHLFESDRALAFSDGVVVRLNKIHREFERWSHMFEQLKAYL